MKKFFTTTVLSLLTLPLLVGQNTVTIDAGASWIGFMTVFNLDGTVNFGDFWAIPDLKSVPNVTDNTVTLHPNFNTYAPGDDFWVNPDTGEGNKDMEANTFIEPGESFNGADLTFTGTVQSNTLAEGYTARYFIKALDPNNNFADVLEGSLIFDLPTEGVFSVSATADQLPSGLIIQYGFVINGRNANPENEAALGSVVIGDAPTSVNELNNPAIEASVYPNPVIDLLSIKSASPVESFQVLDFLGRQVISGVGSNDVDVSDLPTGTYSIIVEVEEGKKAMNFVKN